jgi:hypothetical protein
MSRPWFRPLLIVLAVLAIVLPGVSAAAEGPHKPGQGNHGGTILVGAASRSVLPAVGGGTAYLEGAVPDPADATSLGAFVPEFDLGQVAVGNGDDRAFWVHDDVRVRAMALDDPTSREMVVLVASDLYMIFRVDGDQIRREVAERLADRDPGGGHGRNRPVELIVTATHNHHGPDTAFDVNHGWYDYMIDQTVDAVVEAIDDRQPATLRVASGEHWFGAHDGVDPIVYDPTMNVLQAVRQGGSETIATIVQWNNHPEVTLGYEPPVPVEDCVALQVAGESCETEGRYFTADFPGVLAETIGDEVGGEVLYFNGAVGDLTGPGGTQVWEVDEEHPLGDQVHAPPGAVAPGGGTDYTARNFRRAVIIGEQAAFQALRLLENAEAVRTPRLSYEEEPFFTRLTHRGFRLLLVPDADGRPEGLGHNLPDLYTCPATGPKTDSTCDSDGSATTDDPVLGPIRAGDHLRSSVSYLRIGGDVAFVMLPAEIAGELVMGLPAEFRSTPELWYEEPELHVAPEDFHIPGYVRARVPEEYLFTVGLGNDQLGYAKSITDYRIGCVADLLAGLGACDQLYTIGAIEFPDGVAGETCKLLAENPAAVDELVARFGADAAQGVIVSCDYGQTLGQADGHYPETNSAGWDLGTDILDAVGRLTGNTDPTEVNPDFPGYNDEFPPPPAG